LDKTRSSRRASASSSACDVCVQGRCAEVASRGGTANFSFHKAMKTDENAFAAAIVSIARRRISFTSRSWSVWLARSTRPLACGVRAWIGVISSRAATRPNSVLPSPLFESLALTRKMPCRSE
jgi:hypothetical protein